MFPGKEGSLKARRTLVGFTLLVILAVAVPAAPAGAAATSRDTSLRSSRLTDADGDGLAAAVISPPEATFEHVVHAVTVGVGETGRTQGGIARRRGGSGRSGGHDNGQDRQQGEADQGTSRLQGTLLPREHGEA